MHTAKSNVSFSEYEAAARSAGFDETLAREWGAGEVVDEHTHPFAVRALVVQGEMWLMVGNHTRHLRPGDEFELAHDTPHSERYGPEGAVYWASRRHRPGSAAP